MKQIIFIGLNNAQVPYLKIIKDLGYFIIGIDKNPLAPGAELVDLFINQGYDEYDEIEKLLLAKKNLIPSAVFTAAAQFSHVIAARLASIYNLRYPSEALIRKLLDKSEFYKLFSEKALPIPETKYISNKIDLEKELNCNSSNKRFYVKSDFSKNPKYVYSGSAKELLATKMNWNKDTHFRSCYVMQPEISGTSLRINIIGDDADVYDFESGSELKSLSNNIIFIIERLSQFCKKIDLENWIVKFDVIDTKESFVALDIGIDPPSRMLKKYIKNKENFAKFYVERYLNAFE